MMQRKKIFVYSFQFCSTSIKNVKHAVTNLSHFYKKSPTCHFNSFSVNNHLCTVIQYLMYAHIGVDLVGVDQAAEAVLTIAAEDLAVAAVVRPSEAEVPRVPTDRQRDLVSISRLHSHQMAMLLNHPSTLLKKTLCLFRYKRKIHKYR